MAKSGSKPKIVEHADVASGDAPPPASPPSPPPAPVGLPPLGSPPSPSPSFDAEPTPSPATQPSPAPALPALTLTVPEAADAGDEAGASEATPAEPAPQPVLVGEELEYPADVRQRLLEIDAEIANLRIPDDLMAWRDEPVRKVEVIRAELEAFKAKAEADIAALGDEHQGRFDIAQRWLRTRNTLVERRRAVVAEHQNNIANQNRFLRTRPKTPIAVEE